MRQEEGSSQGRLRSVAKTLFAERGYEATSIADITRAAKTSHSQFMKYYAGKEELRQEIVEQQWSELTMAVTLATSSVLSPSAKLKLALNMFVSYLEGDAEFRAILLLEHAASRERGRLTVSRELREFVQLMDEIIGAMKTAGELLANVDAHALRSALLGSLEGMMRDQLFATAGFPARYSLDQVRSTLATFVESACDFQRPGTAEGIMSAESKTPLSAEDDWIRYYLKLADKALVPSEIS